MIEPSPCPDDERLLAYVDRTLDASARTRLEAHLDGCSTCLASVSAFAVVPHAANIGDDDRYRMAGLIGSGASGLVYRAYDERLQRLVALKLVALPDGASATGALLAEARLLAGLNHPNIVTIHDAGQRDGHVYLAMELVEGGDLPQWLAASERSDTAIVEVFRGAARGLAAAHAAGVTHRDVKPSNILVDATGRARVADFGLADTISPSRNAGTPAYAAPEQRDGRGADAASDQFSLATAMVEALTGDRPAAERLPEATPHALAPVLARARDRDPARRFASMLEFHDALTRASRPRPLPWVVVVLSGAVIGVAATVGLGAKPPGCVSAQAALDGAWDVQRRASVLRGLERTAVPHAAETGRRVVAELDRYAEAWSARWRAACQAPPNDADRLDARCLARARLQLGAIVDVLSRADADAVDGAFDTLGTLLPLARCGDPNSAIAEELAGEQPDPELERRLARALAELEVWHYVQALGRARAVSSALGSHPWDDPLALRSALLQGEALAALGEVDRAEATLREALSVAVRARRWSAMQRAAVELLGLVSGDAGRPTEALQYAVLATELARDWPARLPTALAEVGLVHVMNEDYARAEATYRDALQLLATTESGVGELPRVHSGLALALEYQGKLDAAERHHREALRLARTEYGERHPDTGRAHRGLGGVLKELRRYDEAESEYRLAIAIGIEAVGPAGADVARAHNDLGNVLGLMARYDEAHEQLQRSLVAWEGKGRGHREVAAVHQNLAVNALRRGDAKTAEDELRTAYRTLLQHHGQQSDRTFSALVSLSDLLSVRGKSPEAEQLLRGELAATSPARRDRMSRLHATLGRVHLDNEEYEEAR
ncbi:MAG: tetratricopeptide repeat protein, partial [Myxococcota bacterium]